MHADWAEFSLRKAEDHHKDKGGQDGSTPDSGTIDVRSKNSLLFEA